MKKFFLILILILIFGLNVFADEHEGLGSLSIKTDLNNFEINEAIVGTMVREDGYNVPISLTDINNYKTLFKMPVGTYEIELSFSKIETEKKYTLEYPDSIIVKEDQKSEFKISVNENTETSEVTTTSTSTSTTSVENESEDNNSFRISIVSIVVFLVIILVLIIIKIRNKE